ncbi:MAG: bifunctional methylenetetrahydrofolate dehydrogenase/methenyltetrahydrofolate cyclohydrolase FolD [Clostridia bacterium]|nr:bifunctional methylenetetrahydrofolate dehydrogenase/methenyltetrahydrofolate cyclohydrolase FolD [Clostridia bacterium]
MFQLIDGKEMARQVRVAIKNEVEQLNGVPKLVVVLVGEDPASQIYVRNKEKFAGRVGMDSEVIRFPESTSENELLDLVSKLNDDKKVNGILVQFPVPSHISQEKVMNAVSPAKDVDGLTQINIGKLVAGEKGLTPCTPTGIIEMIKSTGTDISGKNAVVIGRSLLVGKPVAMLLLKENATVTICHSRTQNIGEIISRADIVVAALGKAEFVKGDMIKNGAIVIDVGTNKIGDKQVGDVEFDAAKEKASFISPVPGGVGPMTIAMLLKNTLLAYKEQNNE